MLFLCPRVQASFPAEKLMLVDRGQARLIWDEHGGTFVLRLEGLEVVDLPEPADESRISLEVAPPENGSLAQQIEDFAGRQSLRLGPGPGGAELCETPILVACHVPGRNLFIFCEEPRLTFRFQGGQTMELGISGVFKARRVVSTEPDLIIHLTPGSMCRLLAGMLAWAVKADDK